MQIVKHEHQSRDPDLLPFLVCKCTCPVQLKHRHLSCAVQVVKREHQASDPDLLPFDVVPELETPPVIPPGNVEVAWFQKKIEVRGAEVVCAHVQTTLNLTKSRCVNEALVLRSSGGAAEGT